MTKRATTTQHTGVRRGMYSTVNYELDGTFKRSRLKTKEDAGEYFFHTLVMFYYCFVKTKSVNKADRITC